MELVGIKIQKKPRELFEFLPAKVWRALMLDMHGLPTTDYLIVGLDHVSAHEVKTRLENRLGSSKHGLVVRTISEGDQKSQPFMWITREDALNVHLDDLLSHSSTRYLMAFAPQATPKATEGFVVGRQVNLTDGSIIIEYIRDGIRPRGLDKLSIESFGNHRCGQLVKRPGRFFRSNQVSDPFGVDLLHFLAEFQSQVRGLQEKLEEILKLEHPLEPCFEFTINTHTRTIEFHDFDY